MFNIKSFFKSRRHLDVVKLKLILTFSRLLLRAVLSSECIKMRKIILVIKRLNCLKCLKVLDSLDKIESFYFILVFILPLFAFELFTKCLFLSFLSIVNVPSVLLFQGVSQSLLFSSYIMCSLRCTFWHLCEETNVSVAVQNEYIVFLMYFIILRF